MIHTVRRMAALLLSAALLLTPAHAAFRDVPESHWAYETVQKAGDYKLLEGNGDGTFGAGRSVTRAQYAKMLCRLMDWELIEPERGSFTDNQDKSQWYYKEIETAARHGALLRLSDVCGPNDPLPREEMTAMTMRALGYATLSGIVQDDCPFVDVATNRGYIALAYRMGIVGGVGNDKFSPKTTAGREQAAAVLVRAYERLRGAQQTVVYSGGETVPESAVAAEEIADAGAAIPMYPRAPMESVYAAAMKAGEGGAVALRTAPLAITTEDGAITLSETITDEELEAYLADEATKTYRSARYESSYLINGNTVVWYETEGDLAVKTQLCRMLGVSAIYLTE